MIKKKLFLFYLTVIFFAMTFLSYEKVSAATAPPLKEGTYLTGQTLSVWPSWSLLGNTLGVALPTDPINQLAPAGTCANRTNVFCTTDSQCQTPVNTTSEKCVLHDPETGWSVADRRFSFACSRESYAYRYIVSTTPGFYTVRARFEDTGIPIANFNNFVASFVSTSIFKINDSSGVCNYDQEISTLQSGACGDGRLNSNKGEQCDPPGTIEYKNGCRGSLKDLTVCGRNCQWVASTTLCNSLSKCGNSALESGETCDDGNLNGKYNHCNTTCNGVSALGRCGDTLLQSAYEVCDPGAVLAGGDKYNLLKINSCKWDCQNWGPYCGDNITQTQYGEECDGNQSCEAGGDQGVKICTSKCRRSPITTSSADWACVVSSTAAAVSAPGTCGDAVVGASEACDRGAANNGKACVPTYGAPCSYCSADCQNTIDVQPLQYCGNGVIENPEKCEVSGGIIYAAVANANSTVAAKDSGHNGYQELACSAETTVPPVIKKGAKSCADCAAGVVRNCVQCGPDKNGVSVAGDMINVLDNSIIAGVDGRTPDPLFAQTTNNSALNLAIGNCVSFGAQNSCDNTIAFRGTPPMLVAKAAKNRVSSDFASYALFNPYIASNPPALINSDPICSVDANRYYKYQMYVNYDWTRPLNFPVVAEPPSWQYDLVLSPVVSSTRRAQDLRVVASWVGSGDFYSGVLNPFITNPQIEGPSYYTSSPCAGSACIFSYQYATGTNYYNSPASFKKSGIWYHGFDATSGQMDAEAFTIDTAAMSGNTYSFYARSPSYPIRQFKNTAKLKVDVYLPENDNNAYHFGTPVKTYYFMAATPSDNPNARYWQVFNIKKPSSNLSVSDIIDINAIVTDPAHFQYITLAPVPIVSPIVTIVPTCYDGIQNGAETGLDCGGSCPACPIVSPVVTIVPTTLTASCSVVPTNAFTGQNVNWTATPSGGTGSYTYSWSGTDGLTGASQSVAKSYSLTGTKTGAVNVISGTQSINQPCSNSVTVIAAIVIPPVVIPPPALAVSCSASPTSINTGQNSTWTATPAGGTGSYTYSWSGTDSLTGASQSVAKTYSTAGVKTATVNVISGTQSVNQVCSNSVTVLAVPSAPALRVNSVGSRRIDLAWDVPANTGPAIDGYVLYRGTSSGGETSYIILPPSATSFSDNGDGIIGPPPPPTSGTTYYYQVTARNRDGQSVRSNEVKAVPL